MPVSTENINKEIYDLLRSRGFDPIPLDSKGQQDIDIEGADIFRFDFKEGNENLGTIWVTVESKELNFYIDDDISEHDSFLKFLQFMKRWSQRKLLGFKITNKNHLSGDMKKRTSMKKKEQLGEGYYPMGKKASYSDSVPQVKMILQHTRQIEEGEQRFRNIAKIFVENLEGERFLLPTNRPGLARVFARHIAEGGTPYDDKGQHITTLVEEYTKMAGFVRATKNGQFNESAQKLVNEGINHYQNLRETLSRMTSHRGYNNYFENYTPILNEQSDEEVSLNELFVQETLDPRIESVLPILNRLSKNITEMSEVKELAEWADSLTEVEMEQKEQLDEGWKDYYEVWLSSDWAPKSSDDNYELQEKATFFIDDMTFYKKSDDWIEDKALKFVEKYLDDTLYDDPDEEEEDEYYYEDETTRTLAEPADEMLEEVDTGEYDARKTTPSSKEKQEKVFAKHRERMKNLDEAPGAETLAHNQSTEKSNLKAFDLEEGFSPSEEVADMIIQSMGGVGKLTSDDIYRAIDEYQYHIMDNPERLDADEVAQIIFDKLHSKGIMVPDVSECGVGYENNPMVQEDDMEEGKADILKKIRKKFHRIEETEVDEGLDANQKRAGQLGPTEKVGKKGAVGKLVGASESVELAKLKALSGIK